MEVEEVEEAQRPQGATAAPPPPPPQPADDTTPRIHPSFEDPPPVGAAATVSVDDMAEELRGALLAQVNAETARLFSVDEFDGRFARLIKRFCLYLAEKVNKRRKAILDGDGDGGSGAQMVVVVPAVTREDHEKWKREFGRAIHKRWELMVYYVLYQVKREGLCLRLREGEQQVFTVGDDSGDGADDTDGADLGELGAQEDASEERGE